MTRNQVPVPDAPQICIKKHTYTHLGAEITQKQKTPASIFRCSVSRKKQKETVYPIPIPCQNSYFSFLQSKVLDQSLNSKAPTSLQTSFYTFPAQSRLPGGLFCARTVFCEERRRSENPERGCFVRPPSPACWLTIERAGKKRKVPFLHKHFLLNHKLLCWPQIFEFIFSLK